MSSSVQQKATLLELKKSAKQHLQNTQQWKRSRDPIVLVSVQDEATRTFMVEGALALGLGVATLESEKSAVEGAAQMKKIAKNDFLAFDVIVSDMLSGDIDLMEAMRAGCVPVVPVQNTFSSILKEFNPMAFEGNAFLYDSANPYCIFAKLVGYLENIKFPEDRRILLKHVSETF